VVALGLRHAGFTVETASDGAALLERFVTQPFDSTWDQLPSTGLPGLATPAG
jgi:DNA-binding response OmpR family regulator